MARIQQFEDDLRIISSMADYPGSQEGLTTAEFKAKFDEAALRIQNFINTFLVPAINDYITLGTGYVNRSGDQMTGPLNMGGNIVSGVGTPISDSDATPKSFVVPKSGGDMTGKLGMGGNRITGVAAPEVSSDAATKEYVDKRRIVANILLPAYAWSGDAAPYSMSRTFPDAELTDTPHYAVVYSDNSDTAMAEKEAFAMIDDMETTSGGLVFVCFEEKPEIDLNIQIEIIKGGEAAVTAPAMLLNNSPDSSAISVEVEGDVYGVGNASTNGTATQGSYDFTVV